MFTEGQEVWCAIYGAGIVKRIRQQSGVKYPVVVLFNSNNNDDDDFVITYTSDGKHHTAANVTRFSYPVEIVKAITKPSIDWGHVSEVFQYLAMDSDGLHHLFAEKPDPIAVGWTTHALYIYAEHFASFTPGTCDWRDSLVKRPN